MDKFAAVFSLWLLIDDYSVVGPGLPDIGTIQRRSPAIDPGKIGGQETSVGPHHEVQADRMKISVLVSGPIVEEDKVAPGLGVSSQDRKSRGWQVRGCLVPDSLLKLFGRDGL